MSDDQGTEQPEEHGARTTITAFGANLGIAVAKTVAWTVTGSASMLAESIHSFADSGNQGLLLVGRHRAKQEPDARHPFGYGRERYFWAFVVAMVLFSAGGIFALVEGEEKLRHPHELTSYPWSVSVLAVGLLLEGYSLHTAVKESRTRKKPDESWWGFLRRTTVPELAVVLLEDLGALIGLMLALVGTTLAEVTGNARFDALGSLGIGILLTAIAITLATEMKSLLIGEAGTPDQVSDICDALRGTDGVVAIRDLRTELLGPDKVLVVGVLDVDADSDAGGEAILRRAEDRVRERVEPAELIYLQRHRV